MTIDFEECRELLEAQLEELETQFPNETKDKRTEREARITIARRLLDGDIFATPRVFVSHKFDEYGQDLFNRCKDRMAEYGIEAIEGKPGNEAYPGSLEIHEGIGKLMSTCHFFLAILSPNNHEKPMNEQPLSLWYMLEYGMALMHGCTEYRFVSTEPLPKKEYLPDAVTIRVIPTFNETDTAQFEGIIKKIAEELKKLWDDRHLHEK